MIASISLTFWKEAQIAPVIAVLRHAGWFFDYGQIISDYWRETDELGDNRREDIEGQWPQVSAMLQEKLDAGYRAVVQMSAQDCDCDGNFVFYSSTILRVSFDGPRPRLDNCHRFTDLSSLLKLIVCPLESAKFSLAEVVCEDDRR